jgi:hypothetical protein
MSKALIEKLIRARERVVAAGGHSFTIRRPTDADALAMQERAPLDFVRKFVVGWDLTELELIPGGAPEAVPFDPDLWAAWVGDHPELWEPLATQIVDDYRKHVESREAVEKN